MVCEPDHLLYGDLQHFVELREIEAALRSVGGEGKQDANQRLQMGRNPLPRQPQKVQRNPLRRRAENHLHAAMILHLFI